MVAAMKGQSAKPHRNVPWEAESARRGRRRFHERSDDPGTYAAGHRKRVCPCGPMPASLCQVLHISYEAAEQIIAY